MYPTPQTYILHNLQGQFCSFQRFILALNIFNDVTLFNSVGIISQIFGPRYCRVSSSKEVVQTLLVLKMLFDEYIHQCLFERKNMSHYSWAEAINNLLQFDCQSRNVSNMTAN